MASVPLSASTTDIDLPPAERDWVARGGWYTLFIMIAVGLFAFIDRQVLTLAAAPLSQDLGLSDTQLGVVQGLAFTIFSIIAVYPLAWAADRFDRRLVLGLCIVVWSLGTAACGIAQNFEQLFLAAIAIAAGEAGLAPIVMSMVPDLFGGRKRALANSINYFASYLGLSLGLALGGGAIGLLDASHADLPPWLQQFESWRLAFFMVALPAPLFLVLVAFARLRKPNASHNPTTVQKTEPFLPFFKEQWRPYVSIFGALGFYMIAFSGYLIWLPVAFARYFGATPAENGAGLGLATAIGMICGVVLGVALMRRYMPILSKIAALRISWVTMAVTTPVLLAFPFVQATWQGFVLVGVMMVAGTTVGSLVPNILQDMAPGALRARAIASYTIVTTLLAGAAPTVIGWLSDALPMQRGILIAITLLSIPTWVMAIFLMRSAEQPFAGLVEAVERTEGLTGFDTGSSGHPR